MKKLVLIIAGIIVLGVIYAGITTFVLAPEPQVVVQKKPKANKTVWKGNAYKPVSAQLSQNGNILDILSMTFSKLNTKSASATVQLRTDSVRRKAPAWVTRKGAFTGSVGVTPYSTTTSVKSAGEKVLITVRFKNVPIKALGRTCAKEPYETGMPRLPLYLNLKGFSRNKRKIISTAVLAPDPPANNCLGRGAPFRPKVSIKKLKITGKNKKVKTIFIAGSANTKTKKVRVATMGRTVKQPRVRNYGFSARFRVNNNRKSFVIRVGTNKNPNLASKRIVITQKGKKKS